MRITGEPAAVAEDIRVGVWGVADVAVSETGTLVYATGGDYGAQELVWVTRDGKTQSVDPAWHAQFGGQPALSPNGKHVAIPVRSEQGFDDIWIKQLDRGPSIKLTVEGGQNLSPAWTPDGQSVTFSSDRDGHFHLWTKRADGSAQAVSQYRERRPLFYPRWSPDGKWLIFQTERDAAGGPDILGFRPNVDTVALPLVATKFWEGYPEISPNGRWMAYMSYESGHGDVYVVPFPNTRAAKWAVSTQYGVLPRWSHSGKELFYRDSAANLVSVEVTTSAGFSAGRAKVIVPAALTALTSTSTFSNFTYAVAPDDQRFLMSRSIAARAPDKLIVVENWFEELKSKGARH
jgi:Tol biopolymer transport system component